jgi:hypothetical protein
MGISEKAKLKKALKEEKDKHLDEMFGELKKTKNLILVTDKYTAMSGTTQDVFIMINKMFGWLFDRTPKEVHLMYANYLEELAQEIRKVNK